MNATSFPFTIVEPNNLILGNTYYIQLKPYVLNKIITPTEKKTKKNHVKLD